MSPPIQEREFLRKAIETSAPDFARSHPGAEPSEGAGDSLGPTSRPSLLDLAEKADKRAEKATKVASSLKTWGSLAAAFTMGLGSAYGWAHGKADKADVSAVAASDMAAHEQFRKEQEAQNILTAELKGGQAAIMAQNNEILSMVRRINAVDERRGSPTRLPMKDPHE